MAERPTPAAASSPFAPPPPTRAQARASRLGFWAIGVIVAVIILLGTMAANRNASPDSADAWRMSKEFVRDHLKSPASARFPDYERGYVEQVGSGEFVVSAYVDAQNDYGANLRARWTCHLQYIGDNRWVADDVRIDNP